MCEPGSEPPYNAAFAIVFDGGVHDGQIVREADIDLFDAYNAEKAFLSPTGLYPSPVRSVYDVEVSDSMVPGPMTGKLFNAYSDFAGQHLRHLD